MFEDSSDEDRPCADVDYILLDILYVFQMYAPFCRFLITVIYCECDMSVNVIKCDLGYKMMCDLQSMIWCE